MTTRQRPANILLVEDNEGDVALTRLALKNAKFKGNLQVVQDGDTALDYLLKADGFENATTPDIILLDLNLPGTDGKEVLESLKAHDKLKRIPVIVLTSSSAERDILDSYNRHANCYIVKPPDAPTFMHVGDQIQDFWTNTACLPSCVNE